MASSKPRDPESAAQYPTEPAQGAATGSNPVQALQAAATPQFRFGKRWVNNNGTQMEVFTLTRAEETIDLLPLKNWSQLDVHKWRARGQLPGTPTGLEIAPDHIKLAGEEVYPQQVDACEKLDQRFAEWLKVERDRLKLLKKQADSRAAPPSADEAPLPAQQSHHFEVEKDKSGQVHVRCIQGKETVATIGLTVPGFQSLVSQRLIHQPKTVTTGVLHDWVELDGVLYSFQEGANDSTVLAQALNEKFLPASNLEQGNSIVVFDKAATSTGLELQFAARVGGVPDHHRRPLDEATLELLQDADRCGLLQPGIVVKVAAPYVVFKSRTPDGGEE